jgi:SET family sugar efflux transporter-like MFS transporter
VGLAAALEIPLMPAFGALASRIRQRWLVAGGALAGIGYYATVCVAGQMWLIIVAQVLSAVFVAAIMGIGIGFFQDVMPDRVGSATTLYPNTSKISSMIAGSLVGVANVWGSRSMFAVSATLCAVALILLILPTTART